MKAPIIADNRGDVIVFDSVTKAETYIEPIDVLNHEYVIYDSEGCTLKASVVVDKKGREKVVLSIEEPKKYDREKLRSVLVHFLSHIPDSGESLETQPLERLVAISLRFKTE